MSILSQNHAGIYSDAYVNIWEQDGKYIISIKPNPVNRQIQCGTILENDEYCVKCGILANDGSFAVVYGLFEKGNPKPLKLERIQI